MTAAPITNYPSKFVGAEGRLFTTTDYLRCYETTIEDELAIWEIEILPNGRFELPIAHNKLIVLPLIGACRVALSATEAYTVQSEQLMEINNSTFHKNVAVNNAGNTAIKVLIVGVNNRLMYEPIFHFKVQEIQLKYKNEWADITNLNFIKIGIFDSRFKGSFSTKPTKNVLAYTLSGCFEVENRLLNQSDTLFLADQTVIEYEALTENAILLCIEINR